MAPAHKPCSADRLDARMVRDQSCRNGKVMRLSAIVVIWLGLAGAASAQEARPPATPPVAAPEDAPEPAVTWGAELDTSSRYIWHGLPYSTGAVAWPSAWISTKGLTATLWTNFDPNYLH